MPVKTLLAALAGALALSAATWAETEALVVQSSDGVDGKSAIVESDPQALADDICWVAPEWRDL